MVDLSKCNQGDLLITKHGLLLSYVKPCEYGSYYDHEVEYLNMNVGNGTRTNEGYVFRNNRKESDQDVVEIINLKKLFEEL